MKDKDKEKGELVREIEVMLPNGNGVKTKVYRGEVHKPARSKKKLPTK